MEKILFGGQSVGSAQVWREGLYYRFDCRCTLSGEMVYRLVARCGEQTVHLGIPVPEGNRFVLRTRIPVKKLGEGALLIRVEPKHTELGDRFVPLAPEEPFRYLRRLQDAFMQIRDGQVGIVIKNAESKMQNAKR